MIYSHTISHEPANQAKRYWDEESTPLFPFGFGLSYAPVDYSDLALDSDSVGPEGSITVSVEVANVGVWPAEEVVQLYLHQRHGTASRPVRELKGFRRISLAAGESQTVEFSIGPDERRYWNAAVRDWVLDASIFDVYVGGDSPRHPHRHLRGHRLTVGVVRSSAPLWC